MKHKLRSLCLGLCALVGLEAFAAPAPNANSVLILETTVSGGTSSQEYVQAAASGFTPVIANATDWAAMTAAEFGSFRAIVFGDSICSGNLTNLAPAMANQATWSSVVNGNKIFIGTDERFHANGGLSGNGGNQLAKSGIAFAANISGKTGIVISLECYYHGTAPGTPVPILSSFGTFTVQGVGCANVVRIVATHPALAGLTEGDLSGWFCSVHEGFDNYPGTFQALAIATDVDPTSPGVKSFTLGDSSTVSGVPYILAAGDDLAPAACGNNVIDPMEECDDNNTTNGDGCSAQCKLELPTNEAPDCSGAYASKKILWPVNHKLENVAVLGVSDPEGDAVTITVNGVTQDESVLATASGSGATAPDAVVKTDESGAVSVDVRAERMGRDKDGRVYQISFTATDSGGLSCTNKVQVCVPHDRRRGFNDCVDDGQNYDSTH